MHSNETLFLATLVPWFPGRIGLAALGVVFDVMLTVWAWRRAERWPGMAVAFALSAWLAVLGGFLAGAPFLVLFLLQAFRLWIVLANRGKTRTGEFRG